MSDDTQVKGRGGSAQKGRLRRRRALAALRYSARGRIGRSDHRGGGTEGGARVARPARVAAPG